LFAKPAAASTAVVIFRPFLRTRRRGEYLPVNATRLRRNPVRKAMGFMLAAMWLGGCATNQPLAGLQSIMADADRLERG